MLDAIVQMGWQDHVRRPASKNKRLGGRLAHTQYSFASVNARRRLLSQRLGASFSALSYSYGSSSQGARC